MSGPEFIVALVAICCITGLLKKWMDSRNSDSAAIREEEFSELQDAFEQHKKEMQKRVQNLETIIADEEDIEPEYRQIEAPSSNSTLTNDLQQKEQV